MPRKIGQGKNITELVKGSLEYTMHLIRAAFYDQHRRCYDNWFWVVDTFDNYLIVAHETELAPDEYYRVNYTVSDGVFTFAPREDWEVVELTYQPAGMTEENRQKKSTSSLELEETIRGAAKIEAGDKDKGPWAITAHGITPDVINENGRRYRRHVIEEAVREAALLMEEDPDTLHLSGEADHPTDKGNRVSLVKETIIKWNAITLDRQGVQIEGVLFATSLGRDIKAQQEGGLRHDISQRAWGISVFVEEDGRTVEEITWLTLVGGGYDLVVEGADTKAQTKEGRKRPETQISEGVNSMSGKNENTQQSAQQQAAPTTNGTPQDAGQRAMLQKLVQSYVKDKAGKYSDAFRKRVIRTVMEIEALTADNYEKEVDDQISGYEEILQSERKTEADLRTALNLDDQGDVVGAAKAQSEELETLRQERNRREVNEFIAGLAAQVNYPKHIKEAFLNMVQGDEPATKEAAQEAIARARKTFDKLAADHQLQLQGYGIDVLGPVLEAETGYPEFARVSYRIAESLQKANKGRVFDLRDKRKLSINERFIDKYLENFDRHFKQQLIAEAKMFQEVEATSDLNLPYSVLRAVMAEVWAESVAVSVFDFDTTDQAPTRIFFERYTGESGFLGTITDEDFNSGTFAADAELGKTVGPWVQLAHGRLVPGTVVVNVDGAGALIADDGTNYVIDYEKGRIRMMDGGSSDSDVTTATAYEIDYQYHAIREGESADIEEAKLVLDFRTLEIAADRLATKITSEAVVFSQSQLGWDAVTRTLANLISQIRNDVDKGIFYLGLAAAELVANNSGGSWNSTTGDVADVVKYIGQARVNVESRFYMANAVIASLGNADLVSNWDGFTAAGSRPDAMIDAAGYVGNVKGMPLFRTPNFTDSRILVANRELVIHRIFKAMELFGPFHVTNSGKLVAQRHYYAEEYNGTVSPVEQKGSYVIVS